jgi:hypothetical protein
MAVQITPRLDFCAARLYGQYSTSRNGKPWPCNSVICMERDSLSLGSFGGLWLFPFGILLFESGFLPRQRKSFSPHRRVGYNLIWFPGVFCV